MSKAHLVIFYHGSQCLLDFLGDADTRGRRQTVRRTAAGHSAVLSRQQRGQSWTDAGPSAVRSRWLR